MTDTVEPAVTDAAEPNAKAQAVLRAASTVFLSHGFSAATTDMIQREAGVSKSTVYAHYANKEALFAAVIECECAQFMASVRAVRYEPGDVSRALTQIGQAYLRIVLSPMGLALYRVIVAEGPRFPALARSFYLAGPRVMADAVSALLLQAADAGQVAVQSVGVEAAAQLFMGMIRSQGQLESLTHPGTQVSEAQIDHWVTLAVSSFLRAFGR